MSKTEKKYDCVESVRKERLRIANETEGMSAKEVLAYFQKEQDVKKKNRANEETNT